MAKALESLPGEIRDCRLDIQVDNQTIIHTWHGRGSRSKDLTRVVKCIFVLVTERNVPLSVLYVPSEMNSERIPRLVVPAVNCPNCSYPTMGTFDFVNGAAIQSRPSLKPLAMNQAPIDLPRS